MGGGGWLPAASRVLLTTALLAAAGLGVGEASMVSIRFNTSHEFVGEGNGTVLGIRLLALGAFDQNFTVSLVFTDITANHFQDYVAQEPVVFFTVGDPVSSEYGVTINSDDVYEGTETFQVSFHLPPGQGEGLKGGSPDILTVAIEDDDTVAVFFQQPALTAQEGQGNIALRLSAEGIYQNQFSVSVTCLEVEPVEAEAGTDFGEGRLSLLFEDTHTPASTSTEAELLIMDDVTSERAESFLCVLLKPASAGGAGIVVRDPDTITVLILDNDALQVSFEFANYTAQEGQPVGVRLRARPTFDAAFQAQIFAFSFGPDNVHFRRTEAAIGDDYANPRLTATQGVVTFTPVTGPVSTTLFIDLHADLAVEGTEYFGLDFALVPEARPRVVSQVTPSQATVSILDINELIVRFHSAPFVVREGQPSLEIVLEAVTNVSGVLLPANYTFDFNAVLRTSDNSASSSSDYHQKEQVVNFTAGDRFSSPFTVRLRQDNASEYNETFNVAFTIPPVSGRNGVTILPLDPSSTVTIVDDDLSAVSFNTTSLTVAEDQGVVELHLFVDRVFQDQQTVIISAADLTATAGADYILLTNTATFRPGQLESDPFLVQIVDDSEVEREETFLLTMTIPEVAASSGGVRGGVPELRLVILDDDTVSIQFTQEEYTVGESDGALFVTFEVVKGRVTRPISISLVPLPGTANTLTDYIGLNDSIAMFGVGDNTSTAAAIIIVDDSLLEGNENFTLTAVVVGEEAASVEVVPPTQPTVTIVDNDVLLSFCQATYTVRERAGLVEVCVCREGQRNSTIAVLGVPQEITSEGHPDTFSGSGHVYSGAVSGNTLTFPELNEHLVASADVDFEEETHMVELGSSDSMTCFNVSIRDDSVVELDEKFVVNLMLPLDSVGVGLGSPNQTCIIIENDDNVSVEFFSLTVTVNEAEEMVLIQLVANTTSQLPYGVRVVPSSGSAVAGLDFADARLFADFPPNETVAIVMIPIIDDSVSETRETFMLMLSIQSSVLEFPVVLGQQQVMTVVIDDDDAVVVSLATDQKSVTEGRSLIVQVSPEGAFTAPFLVRVTVRSGTADAVDDFEDIAQVVTLSQNGTSVEVLIRAEDDLINEGEEDFYVELKLLPPEDNNFLVVKTGINELLAIIGDNDGLCVTFESAMYSAAEGSTLEVRLLISSPLSLLEQNANTELIQYPITMKIRPLPSASPPTGTNLATAADYDNATMSVTFQPGSEPFSTVAAIHIINDTILEGNEVFELEIVSNEEVDNRKVEVKEPDVAMVIITTDSNDVIDVSLEERVYSVVEGKEVLTVYVLTDRADFTVTGAVVLNITLLTAGGSDVAGDSTELSLTPGVRRHATNISITDDSVLENNETFAVSLSVSAVSAALGFRVGGISSATVTIVDDDSAFVSFTVGHVDVSEDAGNITVVVAVDKELGFGFTLAILANDSTAVAGTHYILHTPSVELGPGARQASVVVEILDNDIAEGNSVFSVYLSLPDLANMREGENTTVAVTILDDEMVTIGFSQDLYSNEEYKEFIQVTLLLDGRPPAGLQAVVHMSDRTANSEDYLRQSISLHVTEPVVHFNITVFNDDFPESNDSIALGLDLTGNPDGAVSLGTITNAIAIILDDDTMRQLVFTVDNTTFSEGSQVTVTLTIGPGFAAPISLTLRTRPITAEGGIDYDSTPQSVTFFTDGPFTMTFTISILDDSILEEPEEYFDISLDGVPSSVTVVGESMKEISNVTVAIRDNEVVTMAFENTLLEVDEGDGEVVVTVNVIIPDNVTVEPGLRIPIVIEAENGTAVATLDFFPGPYNVVINFVDTVPADNRTSTVLVAGIGRSSFSITIPLVSDSMPEGSENFTLRLTTNRSNVRAGPPATVVILDPILGGDIQCIARGSGVIAPFHPTVDPSPAEYSFVSSCEYELVSLCNDSRELRVYADFGSDLSVEGAAVMVNSSLTTIEADSSQELDVPSLGLTVQFANGSLTVRLSSTSSLTPSLCGLCGDMLGSLVDRAGQGPTGGRRGVERVAQSYRVPPESTTLRPARPECAALRNDTVISDPLLTVPLLLPGNIDSRFASASLCLEFHGLNNTFFNYISDECVSVNVHYTAVDALTNVIDGVGVVAIGNSQCHLIEVALKGCVAFYDNETVSGVVRDDGITVMRSGRYVRMSVPNCDGTDLVMWAVCQSVSSQSMLKLVVSRGLNLRPTSHGVLGQFWNIPTSVDLFEDDYGSGSGQLVSDYFVVTVTPPDSAPRRFVAEYGPHTWENVETPCLFAGNFQGGSLRELRGSPNDPVIQGFYTDYIVDGLFQPIYAYSRFNSSTC